MTWLKFALWLSVLYLFYYAALILWDHLRSGRQPSGENAHELTFEEDLVPTREVPDTAPQIYDSSILSSGGVSLKQLFNLAREEAIEFTRPVSF